MMNLVNYSDSSSDDDDDHENNERAHPSKRRRLSNEKSSSTLPPLPASFRDLYSSTVRTSTQDDPSLHGGRKRVTPHVAGNWPAHVYLEWCPKPEQQSLIEQAFAEIQSAHNNDSESNVQSKQVHSLLKNDLGVDLPLHVSLSRPLTLKTAQKDDFLNQLKSANTQTSVSAFSTRPINLIWHPNEDKTRWFLVLQLERPPGDELQRLLKSCNQLAGEFGQPLLYHKASSSTTGGRSLKVDVEQPPHDSFHISVAWLLQAEGLQSSTSGDWEKSRVSQQVREKLQALQVEFEEVKVRIGQDVTSIPLRRRRRSMVRHHEKDDES